MSAVEKVNLAQKLGQFRDHWKPRIVGELNGQQVKLVKFQGEFVWHHHDDEDEMFLVVKGRFRMEFRDRAGLAGRGRVPRRPPRRRAPAGRGGRGPRPALRAGLDPEYRQCPERADGRGPRADLSRRVASAERSAGRDPLGGDAIVLEQPSG